MAVSGVAATAANAEQAEFACVCAFILADEIGGGADIFNAVLRFVGVTRCAAACALVGGVKGDGQITLFGEFLRV